MIAAIGEIKGEPLTPRPVPVTAGPLPPAAASDPMVTADMISTFAHYDRHGFRGNPRVFELLLGRPPANFIEVARRELAP